MCEVVCKLFRPIVVGGLCKKAYETRGSGDAGTRPVSVYSIPCQRPLFHEEPHRDPEQHQDSNATRGSRVVRQTAEIRSSGLAAQPLPPPNSA